MTYQAWFRGAAALVLVGLIAAVGCGGGSKARGIVKGSVTFKGKKLNAGMVTFSAKDGRAGTGSIDDNGNYIVTDAPATECTVLVGVPARSKGSGMTGPPGMGPPGGMIAPPAKMPAGIGGDKMGPPPKMIDPSKVVQIPEKYSKSETSDLKFTVRTGEQTFEITLTP